MSKCLQTLSLCVALVATAIPPSAAQQNQPADIKADPARDHRVHKGLQARLASGRLPVRPSPLMAGDSQRMTWRDNPSLMDTSWRRWPSVTDF